ncbi:ATP-binding protein [Actinomadura fulvescens]|uniref:Histidine kinase/HSP90-like ATPase domain-containing protein n=1 Tax=Actinomadura fulvescens TaxID=46160 RepID=A0ABP6BMQ6_9ACTN
MSATRSPRSDEDPFVFTVVLKPVNTAIKEARDIAAFAWSHWKLGDDYIVRLVVSELVTNAVKASREDQLIAFRCYLGVGGCPVVEVWDESPEPIVLKAADSNSESGRGIFIVDHLVDDWTVESLIEGGKLIRVTLGATDTPTHG